MKMTYDDQYLITISEDSCVMIWKVQDREGRNLKRDKEILYSEEILITKSDLEDKVCTLIFFFFFFFFFQYLSFFVDDSEVCTHHGVETVKS